MITVEAHSEGLGGAAFIGKEPLQIITGGNNGRICIRGFGALAKEAEEIRRTDLHPIHCVAAHPKRTQFAIGDKAKGVHIYQHPRGHCVLGARLQLPVLMLSYNGTGEKLAAGGEDECIHIVNIKTNPNDKTLKAQVLRKLKAVPHTRGLSYDPQGEFVAAMAASGLLQIWEMMDGKQILSRKKAGPDIVGKEMAWQGIDWHPEGLDLAAAGPANDIILYERHNWQTISHLDGEHTASISCLLFSPNGLYLASAGLDRKLIVWDLHKKEKLAEQELPAEPLSIDWKPEGNCLMCMTSAGKMVFWDDCIPRGNTNPCEAAESPIRNPRASASMTGSGGEDDDREEPDAGLSENGRSHDSLDDIINNCSASEGKRSPPPKSRFDLSRPQPGRLEKRHLQRPFQSGCMPRGANSDRWWLCYNMRGGISLKEDEDMSILEVSFHDTLAENRRVPPYRDYNGLDMAALGERGVLYARRGEKGEESMLKWRPFQSPYANSEWTISLPSDERIEAITAGKSFLAAATSLRHLRLFTTAGLQLAVNIIAGPIVTMAAKGDLLALVWHGSNPPNPSDQSLMFAIYNVNTRGLVAEGPLPITTQSTLKWIAFTEEHLLASFDSEGILRVRATDFGGAWTPIFDSANHQQGGVSHWPVAVTKAELYCICCAKDSVPAVLPRPILTRLPLRGPVLGRDQAISSLEGDWIRLSNHLAFIRSQKDEAGDPDEVNQLDAEELRDQTDADRCVLKLFQDSLKTGRLQRAQELAACLHLERSLEGALKLTNLHKIPLLAERIGRILESMRQEHDFDVPSAGTPIPSHPFVLCRNGPPSAERPSPPSKLAAFTEASGNGGDAEEVLKGPMEENIAGSETKPASRMTGTGSSLVSGRNPFARKGTGPLKEKNTLFHEDQFTDSAGGKRKTFESNPFMRRPKAKP